ncbi:MAG TPA: hypothetical protein PLD59_13410, partial [Tepidisphaeraceae bacterium]|nr:hypothetical protein [Tepidisphaeraceae bacterium]
AAYLAAAVGKAQQPGLTVGHLTLPAEAPPDRLAVVNPKLFELHPLLKTLRKPFCQATTCGALFLSEKPPERGDYSSNTATSAVVGTNAFTNAAADIARAAGVFLAKCKSSFDLSKVEDSGVEMLVDGQPTRARVLIVASPLPQSSGRVIGHAFDADRESVQRYHFAAIDASKVTAQKQLAMSLDLNGTGAWAWLLRAGETAELAVMQPTGRAVLPAGGEIGTWMANLVDHGLLPAGLKVGATTTLQLPVAGALSGETVANRTLLVGPAGGFFSACNEDLYPGCWSAILAADVAVAALGARHVQDALLSYRESWGSTVGDYLRGPQQNLRLLLPLIYRNPIMAARVGEAIFLGESVVR